MNTVCTHCKEEAPLASVTAEGECTSCHLYTLTRLQITLWAKKLGIAVNFAHSCGGGNRDHRTWQIELFTDWQKPEQRFHTEQVTTHICSGRFDGKAACEREAKELALRAMIIRVREAA